MWNCSELNATRDGQQDFYSLFCFNLSSIITSQGFFFSRGVTFKIASPSHSAGRKRILSNFPFDFRRILIPARALFVNFVVSIFPRTFPSYHATKSKSLWAKLSRIESTKTQLNSPLLTPSSRENIGYVYFMRVPAAQSSVRSSRIGRWENCWNIRSSYSWEQRGLACWLEWCSLSLSRSDSLL